jgi:hypothetical protein
MPTAAAPPALTSIPNVGPAIAHKLLALDIHGLDDLRGRDPEELFERLCALDGRRHDPCLLDTFVAAVDFANGAPPRPWWEYSRARKARSETAQQHA